MTTAKGSCLCGSVNYTVTLPSKWCAHCHCSLCRKAHGAGYVTWVGMEEKQFTLGTDVSTLVWYQSTTTGERGFCNQCGSTLFFKGKQWADEIHIALASFDEPIDRKPQTNAYLDAHVDWMPIDDALAVHRG